jgi:H+-transporting ATPase
MPSIESAALKQCRRQVEASPDPNVPIPIGLSAAEVRRRLDEFGPNAMPDATPDPWRRLLGKFIAPVPCMLEAAISLQLILGETVEASVIAALLVFNAALGFFQEVRAQATLDALKSRLALSASVRRDGRWTNVPVAALVPGDIVKLSYQRPRNLTLGGIPKTPWT